MALRDHLAKIEPTLLVAIGFVLVVFPEPATSAFGVGLMLLGVAWWVQEWRTPADVDGVDDGGRIEQAPRR